MRINFCRIAFFAGISLYSLLSVNLVVAEEGLGPMSGVGGVDRDAERRVLAPATNQDSGNIPVIQSDAKPEGSRETIDPRIIGEISAVRILGSVEFAEKQQLAEKILAEIGPGEKTVEDVSAALKKVRTGLQNRGYFLFRISLLPEETYSSESKTLTVLVDEGHFGRISFKFGEEDEGKWFSKQQIERRFRLLKEGDTFDYLLLRNVLTAANSHPDLNFKAVLDVRKVLEGEDENQRIARYSDADFSVQESFPLHMMLEVNNYGQKTIEEWQTTLTAQYLNLTKHDDVLTISPSMTVGSELQSIAGSYILPHYYWLGGDTTLYGGYSRTDVDDIVPYLDLDGDGHFAGLRHSENLYDDIRHQLSLSVSLMWRHIEDEYTVLGYKLGKRSADIMPLTLAVNYAGKQADCLGGRNFATVQGVYNLSTSGGKLEDIWEGAAENYWLMRWQLARLQPLFGSLDETTGQTLHQWLLLLKLEGQYTSDQLIPVEKLSLGGHDCLRGYTTRGYSGDYGVYGTIELRTPTIVNFITSRFSEADLAMDRLQFLAFYDYGIVKYNNQSNGVDNNKFLCSAGIGARLAVSKYSQLRCDVAFPLIDGDNNDDRGCEVYFGLQVQF